MSNSKNIFVTQPSLAPLDEFTELLEQVWESGILTHNGPMVQRLEKEMCHWLGLDHCSVVTNGTIAIQMAIKALELKGEIITTPFTWVATLSAIKWEGCTPVFCDIEPDTYNIDPATIEDAITDETVAIMPVHVFGNPCDVDAIDAIAQKHGLKVIYDAAHAIGSTYKGRSILEYGDISATSLHATKLLNTGEGGGCITTDDALAKKLERVRFFGHDDNKNIIEDGFNGKMTEIHAALGVANMRYADAVLEDRKRKYHMYLEGLSGRSDLQFQNQRIGESNYSYFPVVFESEEALLKVEQALQANHIYARRYFYPSVNTLEHIVDYQAMSVSEDLAQRILCLPLYWKLEDSKVEEIISIVCNS